MKIKFKSLTAIIALLLAICLAFTSCDAVFDDLLGNFIDNDSGLTDGTDNDTDGGEDGTDNNTNGGEGGTGNTSDTADGDGQPQSYDLNNIPEFSGDAFVYINENKPLFEESEIVTESYETYGARDSLGRCTVTMACIGKDIMPTEARGSISSVKPTGWIQATYSCVNGGSLYNRCHLIGYQLTGENANWENLITGTRFMNEAMIPFESMVADYIKETNNHVMYRVTPIFEGNNLVASGVLMEAYSVEDEGEGIEFCVYLYNCQPGIYIDYATGESHLEDESASGTDDTSSYDYIININNNKIHKSSCGNVSSISEKNKQGYNGDVQELLDEGYVWAGCCKPS